MEGEAYLDIVWKQFKKNRAALLMLRVLGLLALLAILAPLLASNQPFWYSEKDRILFPWFVALVNPEAGVDFAFNVAMIVLLPWVAAAILLDRAARKAAVPARRRVILAASLFLGMFVLTLLIFVLLKAGGFWRGLASFSFVALVAGLVAALRGGVGRSFGVDRRCLLAAALPLSLLLALCVALGLPSNKYFDRDFRKDQILGRGAGPYTLIPYGPLEQDTDIIYKRPFFRKTVDEARIRETQPHFMGTDDIGRDVLVRLLYGTRISLTIGVVAVSMYVYIGIIIGGVAGYFGGRVDMMLSRLIEIVLLFPSFFLILTLVALIGPSLYMIMVVIGATAWPTTARLMRGEFLRQRSIDYVAAARALGASDLRVMFRHILPNALSPIFVSIPFGIASAIVTEASLSVLGFGARPPTPSWGAILSLATTDYEKWWLTLFAGLAIFLTMTVFNIVGNGLRDAMDPRLKGTS